MPLKRLSVADSLYFTEIPFVCDRFSDTFRTDHCASAVVSHCSRRRWSCTASKNGQPCSSSDEVVCTNRPVTDCRMTLSPKMMSDTSRCRECTRKRCDHVSVIPADLCNTVTKALKQSGLRQYAEKRWVVESVDLNRDLERTTRYVIKRKLFTRSSRRSLFR